MDRILNYPGSKWSSAERIINLFPHMKLLSTLKNHRGPVILSGYNSDLYAKELKGWSKIEFDSATGNVGRKKKIAIECLWCNFDPVEQMELFKLEV